MKTKGRVTGLICLILTAAYAAYMVSGEVILAGKGENITAAVLAPLSLCTAAAAVLVLVGVLRKVRWAFLAAGILLAAATVIALMLYYVYAVPAVVAAVLAFMTYAQKS